MERKFRYVWWVMLGFILILAVWKLFLPHGQNAVVQKSASNRELVVYVSGAVEKPGLVHLAPDARLDDALKQVRLSEDADLESMNPAEKLKDGQKITVPHKIVSSAAGLSTVDNPVQNGNNAKSNMLPGVNTAGLSTANSGTSGLVGSSSSNNGKININTADKEELDKLPGVGPALADRIIQYRTEHGAFVTPEDLQNVSGIGTKTYEKMAAQVTVSS